MNSCAEERMNEQWHRFFLSLLRITRIILAFSLINFRKCNFNLDHEIVTWEINSQRRFDANKIVTFYHLSSIVIDKHVTWNLQYLNEYDIHKLESANKYVHCRLNPRSGKDSFDSLFGRPSTLFPTVRNRKFQRNELPALLACTFGGNSVSTVNSRLCDRNQRRSLLLQRLIKTNRCATGAGTCGERSRGVGCRIEDENSSVDLPEDWIGKRVLEDRSRM